MKKVYYNPRCSKCRIAGSALDEKNINYQKYEYLNEGITKKDIEEILSKGGLNIEDILRNKEPEYIENIKGKDLSDEQKIEELIKHPKMLQRPIIVSYDKAIIARDEETLNNIS